MRKARMPDRAMEYIQFFMSAFTMGYFVYDVDFSALLDLEGDMTKTVVFAFFFAVAMMLIPFSAKRRNSPDTTGHHSE